MDEHRKFVLDELQILQLESSRQAEQDAARERQFAEKQRQLEAEARKQIEELSKATTAMAAELQQDRIETAVNRIMEWLAPPAFGNVLEESQKVRKARLNGFSKM
ncbi:hypothetical protein K4K57_000781 [Colletotrichum sp. SAR 10_99]|nr:hypothetical protein K4K55_011086 [Colletotrichum sp. SAR 10_96]KAJ5014959.1 hypothetical protein K4K57_000781 [Colletotrichum sp. SAR 10_99]